MANFNTHLTVAFIASAALSITCHKAELLNDEQLILMTLTGTVGGLLPDIDSRNSKPVALGFNLIALVCAFTLVIYLRSRLPLLQIFLASIFGYGFVRYMVLGALSGWMKHRGIVHSVPYMAMLALLLVHLHYYVFDTAIISSWIYGLFLFFGGIIHLTLDEIYSVDLLGMRVKSSFGTALKIYNHKSRLNFSLVYLTLSALVYYAPPFEGFWLKISNESTWLTLKSSLM